MKHIACFFLCLSISTLTWAQALLPNQQGSNLESSEVLSIVVDGGVLPAANRDLYASSFVSTGFSSDGGTGTYAFLCNGPSCTYKLAEGSSMEMVASDNNVTFQTGAVTLPTTFLQALSCKPSSSCFLNADVGSWIFYVPTADTSGCTGGTAGGIKFRSTDSRHVSCTGTSVQRMAYSLSNTASVDFSSMASEAGDIKTLTVTGATIADAVDCSPSGGAPEDGLIMRWFRVSAADTVTLAVINQSGGVLDPAALNYTCVVTR